MGSLGVGEAVAAPVPSWAWCGGFACEMPAFSAWHTQAAVNDTQGRSLP